MGSEVSCFSCGRLSTAVESLEGGTDGEQTEFVARTEIGLEGVIKCKLELPYFNTDVCKSPTLTSCGEGAARIEAGEGRRRIFSSNVSKNCVNLIESVHNLSSPCSTRFNSRSNSRCVSPGNKEKGVFIGR